MKKHVKEKASSARMCISFLSQILDGFCERSDIIRSIGNRPTLIDLLIHKRDDSIFQPYKSEIERIPLFIHFLLGSSQKYNDNNIIINKSFSIYIHSFNSMIILPQERSISICGIEDFQSDNDLQI